MEDLNDLKGEEYDYVNKDGLTRLFVAEINVNQGITGKSLDDPNMESCLNLSDYLAGCYDWTGLCWEELFDKAVENIKSGFDTNFSRYAPNLEDGCKNNSGCAFE